MTLCECGCGQEVKPGNRFIHGHNGRGEPRTPETCAILSKAMKNSDALKAHNESMRGVPQTPEHIAAVKKGMEESGMFDRQRGGNDIIRHHHIYDHDDLSKYTIEMTRSHHMSLHRNMQLLGLKVPHINTGHENADYIEYVDDAWITTRAGTEEL